MGAAKRTRRLRGSCFDTSANPEALFCVDRENRSEMSRALFAVRYRTACGGTGTIFAGKPSDSSNDDTFSPRILATRAASRSSGNERGRPG